MSNAGGTIKGLVTTVDADVIDVAPYNSGAVGFASAMNISTSKKTTILVYGSEYTKGTKYFDGGTATTQTDQRGANEPSFQTFTNKPIIMKDYYEVSGSDTARIGWVEVTSEGGASGYLWYLKAEADTRARFTDYLEMAMLEGELNDANSVADSSNVMYNSAQSTGGSGTEGLFAAIESRGNMSSGITGGGSDLDEFDAILAEFDSQGAIEENMMFLNLSLIHI